MNTISKQIFSAFPNSEHIGEIFTPEEYVIRITSYLKHLVPPSKDVTIIDPCAGLGQFECYLQEYTMIANEVELDNFRFLQEHVAIDYVNNVNSLAYSIPDKITAVIANPPYSGPINNGKSKRSEIWTLFLDKYFFQSNIPLGLFIIPCKWMTMRDMFLKMVEYLYFVDILDASKFLLKKSKWGMKKGISARIMSGVCIVILSKSKPDRFGLQCCSSNVIIKKNTLRDIGILPISRSLNVDLCCQFIRVFMKLTSRFGNIGERFLSQYHYEIHNKKALDKSEIDSANIYQSRRKRLLNKPVNPLKFRVNTHLNDYKCILATSNECWNGYRFNFPVTVLQPGMVYTSNYIGFWGTENECKIMRDMFLSKEFNVLLCMIKQTQNFNSNYLWCTPLITSKTDFTEFQRELSLFEDFMETFPYEQRRSYDKSKFYKE